MGLSTLEHYVGALGGRLEIHAVLDDADTKLTALIGAADRKQGDGALAQSHESLAARDALIHAGAGTCCGCRWTPATRPQRRLVDLGVTGFGRKR